MGEEVGKRVGDYEILAVLGAGGMGKVYKVRNVISDRVEAMKVLLPDLAGRQELASRFLREIKILAALNHPNIAALRTALTLDNQLVMIMEYVEGKTLAARLEQGPIPPSEAIDCINQVLDALSYAHGQSVIHRDIKPSNMMLTPQGVVKLMDFGIARSGRDPALTMTGTTMGSLYYMSPEQVRGEVVDYRSDLYSVGVSLYEMVTGQRPFQSDSDVAIMAAHLQQTPKPPIELRPDLPKPLSDIIMTAMTKNPAERFPSAAAFRVALKAADISAVVAGTVPQEVPTAPMRPAEDTLSSSYCFSAAPVEASPVASTPTPTPTTPAPTTPQAQPLPSVLELSPPQRRHRGLYMGLGALIVVAVLVAAGLYVPRRSKASAGGSTGSVAKTTPANSPSNSISTPASDSIHNPQMHSGSPSEVAGRGATTRPVASPPGPGNPESPVPDASVPDSNPSRPDISSPKTHRAQSRPKGSVVPAGQRDTFSVSPDRGRVPAMGHHSNLGGSGDGTHAQSVDPKELEDLERQIDQLASRAGAVHDSLDGLRRQQASQGLSLRGDIASAQQRMDTYLSKAQAAMQKEDATASKKYMALAEPEIEKLEKFLGR
jgi:eukaryotic-like serine/threonine-protein kinase